MPAGYYLTTDSPPNIREFPTAERIQSTPQGRRAGAIGRRNTDIEHETEESVFWIYKQSRRRSWTLIFRIHTEAMLQFFEDHFLAVDGRADAWYFIPDINESPQQVYLVRNIRREFLPPGVDATTANGYIVQVFDYALEFEEESQAAQILA